MRTSGTGPKAEGHGGTTVGNARFCQGLGPNRRFLPFAFAFACQLNPCLNIKKYLEVFCTYEKFIHQPTFLLDIEQTNHVHKLKISHERINRNQRTIGFKRFQPHKVGSDELICGSKRSASIKYTHGPFSLPRMLLWTSHCPTPTPWSHANLRALWNGPREAAPRQTVAPPRAAGRW